MCRMKHGDIWAKAFSRSRHFLLPSMIASISSGLLDLLGFKGTMHILT